MSAVAEYQVDQNVVNRFRLLDQRKRLAHAYLFIGPDGSGQFETALAVAKMLNCESVKEPRPCGQCAACLKMDSGNHPDLIICDAANDSSIKIHQVRDVVRMTQLCPYEAKWKIVVIHGADVFTPDAANALLKTLEEPSPRNVFLLTTSVPDRVLTTIRSRCHAVHFYGQACTRLSQRLATVEKIPHADADFLSRFSEGCYGKAVRLNEDAFIAWKNEVIDWFLHRRNEQEFLKAVLSDSLHAQKTLQVLLCCFKDLLMLKARVLEGKITNADRVQDLQLCAPRYSMEQLQEILAQIVSTQKMVEANLNIKIPFMLLKEKIWLSN